MNGQLWQECSCGCEPVCCSCEKCKKHCRCSKHEKIDTSVVVDPYRRGLGSGFGSTDDGDPDPEN